MAADVSFKIWGIDNVVYGPVDLPTLMEWVGDDRVVSGTWVYKEGHDSWEKASQLPELQSCFAEDAPQRAMSAYDTELLSEVPGLKPGSLRRIKVFSALSDEQLGRFIKYMAVKKVRQFHEIVKQGEPGDGMYCILQGEVRVRLIIDGKESTLATLSAGDFFGEVSLFDHGPRSADVVANIETTLFKIGAGPFEKLCSEAPELATPFLLAVARTLTGRIRADNKRFRDSVAWARITR